MRRPKFIPSTRKLPWNIRHNRAENTALKAAKAVVAQSEARFKPRRPLYGPGKQTHFMLDGVRHDVGRECWCEPHECPECECALHNQITNGEHYQQCELCDHGIVAL